ncbi:MAG: TerB family tellurite resistance protein [bacterium]
MDKFQAAFEILYFLSAVDGKVSDSEVTVMIDFLESNQGKIRFSPKSVINSISSMTGKGIIEEIERAALVFKNASNAQDRITMLDFALNLIASDGKITDNEKNLFFILGSTWNVDVKKYLADKIS